MREFVKIARKYIYKLGNIFLEIRPRNTNTNIEHVIAMINACSYTTESVEIMLCYVMWCVLCVVYDN